MLYNSKNIVKDYRQLIGEYALNAIAKKHNKTQYEINEEILSKKLYDGKVYGIGEMDIAQKYNVKWNTEHSKSDENPINKYQYFSYTLWTKILERITDVKNFPNYIGCTVEERWLSFSNFVEDLPTGWV